MEKAPHQILMMFEKPLPFPHQQSDVEVLSGLTKKMVKRRQVSCQQLVPSLSIQKNGNASFFCKPHHFPLGVHTSRAKGLILIPDQLITIIQEVFLVWENIILFGTCPRDHLLNEFSL